MIQQGGVWQHLTGTADLAGQRLIHVELSGYGTAAIEVQVVLAAQLALLTQGWLTGCPLLLEIAARAQKEKHIRMGQCKCSDNTIQFLCFIK